MGGDGSGRKPLNVELKNKGVVYQPQTPIATEMFLPNYSGIKPGLTKTSTVTPTFEEINTEQIFFYDGVTQVGDIFGYDDEGSHVIKVTTDEISLDANDTVWLLGGSSNVFIDSTGFFTDTPFVFRQTTQGYYIFDHDASGHFSLRNSKSGAQTQLSLYAEDGDGTDGVFFSLTAKGTVENASTALERLNIRYAAAATNFVIFTQAGGTGTVRPLSIYTGANTTQLVLNVDGTTTISKGVYSSSDGTAGATGSKSWRDETAGVTHNVTYKNGLITAWSAC